MLYLFFHLPDVISCQSVIHLFINSFDFHCSIQPDAFTAGTGKILCLRIIYHDISATYRTSRYILYHLFQSHLILHSYHLAFPYLPSLSQIPFCSKQLLQSIICYKPYSYELHTMAMLQIPYHQEYYQGLPESDWK